MNIIPLLIAFLVWGFFGYFMFRYFKFNLLVQLKNYNKVKKYGSKTDGYIIDNVLKTDSEGAKHYYPVIEFTTSVGEQIRFVHQSGFGVAKKKGRVGIIYDIDNPTNCYVNNSTDIVIN